MKAYRTGRTAELDNCDTSFQHEFFSFNDEGDLRDAVGGDCVRASDHIAGTWWMLGDITTRHMYETTKKNTQTI
jgi:hypothetical protein